MAGTMKLGRAVGLGMALGLTLAGAARAETAAKDLFSAEHFPSAAPPQSIGFYSKGCLAGGMAMPKDGPTWQVMKPSRDRAYAHPALIKLLQRLSVDARREANWRGLLFGDMAQPRGGPMKDGHASHQIGLDADIYLTEMPNRRLTDDERDHMPLPSVIDKRTRHIDLKRWRPEMMKLIRTAATEPEVERIFVHPGIKEQLCKTAGRDRAWLNKVRPMYGHDYHFHVRMVCQPGSPNCQPQEPTVKGDGCDKLDWWFDVALQPPKPSAKPYKKPPPIFLSALPRACAAVLKQPDVAGARAAAPLRAAPVAADAPAMADDFDGNAPMALAPEPAPRASAAPVPPAAVPDDGGFAMPRMRPAG
ncbi:penicillin-insensitive murein endopeptidase [Aureimonas sp. Leaf324]|jgi:penicillin-insensitive murein endopeptidase|uniref:penicillin-insensitive murein endopeptidase n=1 Tax=Aureimonas sp. Leaf324 TaxID=1736336 RepID=UPI0006F7BF8B|nr:penicillin-insensitive murein endopeptidase [Aureimonas sp. Leaf324]KQQ79871.1 peptidase [Aureimonas sp. Leaf324]